MYTGPKWPSSTRQTSSRLHGHFGLVYLLQVSKIDDEKL